MAMVGLLFVCLMVYKKTMVNNKFAKNNSELNIENALNLSQRKTLYVIKAGNEKFLIASDVERTSFLAKLNANEETSVKAMKSALTEAPAPPPTNIQKPVDYSDVMSAIKKVNKKQPVLKEILKGLNAQSELNARAQAQRASAIR